MCESSKRPSNNDSRDNGLGESVPLTTMRNSAYYGSVRQDHWTQSKRNGCFKLHRVKKGDNLAHLCILYGVSSAEIMRFNNSMGESDLWGRDTLKIPVPGSPKLMEKECDGPSADQVPQSSDLSSADFFRRFDAAAKTNCVQARSTIAKFEKPLNIPRDFLQQ